MKWVAVAVMLTAALTVQASNEENSVQAHHGHLWAVLLAGSTSWMNYRHQADVCHAYQILHQHGVPDHRIIVMMYDDLAHNEENPTPGVVINRPDGPNVYPGVLKDYTGKDVTPENFLKVLRGDAEGMKGIGSGRVLKTGPNDRVFINMVDHGAPGLFAFPDEILNATDLADTLLDMHTNQKYFEMVLYVESCESGSLFKNLLPHDINVYALSASSPHQHSYACYFDNHLGTFLGDVFSVKWMEDSDIENLHYESLKAQFLLVRKEVNTSTVMHWGDLKLGSQKVSRFLGPKKPHSKPAPLKSVASSRNDPCLTTSVPNPDVPITILQAKKRKAETPEEQQHWQEQIDILHNNRLTLKMAMWNLVRAVTGQEEKASYMLSSHHQHDIVRWSCYLDSVRIVHTRCFNLAQNVYGLRLLHALVNLCEHGYTADQVLQATASVCPIAVSGVM
ncbi:legumain-like isoform X1 [Portunus trituberculatus]|uniref:legumain-like isoform X1 n=1 Tax=Portunus trituberculatus TaxID=210409 RepID=UPI001E1CBA70|nr:legumain-like isoform X1 [Portunus trituberculatus]